MKVIVINMRRDGIAFKKSMLREQTERRGYLTLNDTTQNHLHRIVRTARLFRDAECSQQIQELLEANVLWINDERMMINGFEHRTNSHGAEIDYAQSWLVLKGWDQTLKAEQFDGDHGPKSQRG